MPEWRMLTPSPPSPFTNASGLLPATSGSTMDALYQAALGPVQRPRYLALFERFDRLGRAPAGWNWAASLATLNWMLLHHLWTAALIYVALVEGLALLIFGVGRPLLHWPEQVEWGLIAAFALFAIALPGLFGDALLHAEIRKRVARALVAAQSIPQTCELLARQASSWRRLQWIAAANVLLFAAIAVAWFVVPPAGWSRSPPAATVASGTVNTALPVAAPLPGASQPLASASSPSPEAGTEVAAEPAVSASTPAASIFPMDSASAPQADTTSVPSVTAGRAVEAPRQPSATMAPAKTAASAPVAEGVADSTPDASARPAAATAPAPTPSAAPASESAPPSTRPVAALGKAPGYYLNVGVFAQEANARRAQAKLLNANLPAFRQSFDTPNGKRTRVRVGPFATTAEAQKAAAQIRGLQLDAVMYRQP